MLPIVAGCSRSNDGAKADSELSVDRLTPSEWEKTIRDWRAFRSKAEVSITTLQKRIDAIRDNIYQATVKDKVKIRRVLNKSEFHLTKLEVRIAQFDEHLYENRNSYTKADREKITNFIAQRMVALAILPLPK